MGWGAHIYLVSQPKYIEIAEKLKLYLSYNFNPLGLKAECNLAILRIFPRSRCMSYSLTARSHKK